MKNPDKVEACTVIDVNSKTTPDGTIQSCHRSPVHTNGLYLTEHYIYKFPSQVIYDPFSPQ